MSSSPPTAAREWKRRAVTGVPSSSLRVYQLLLLDVNDSWPWWYIIF